MQRTSVTKKISSGHLPSYMRCFFLGLVLSLLIIGVLPVVSAQNNPGDACPIDLGHLGSTGKTYIGSGGNVQTDSVDVMNSGGLLARASLADVLDKEASITPETIDRFMRTENNKVLLLIIDDFTTPLSQTTLRTHGDYVLETATVAYHSIYGGHRIVIDTLDYADGIVGPPTLENVITKLKQRLSQTDYLTGYDVLVLSMSWIIMPCDGSFESTIGEFSGVIPVNLNEFIALQYNDNIEYKQQVDFDGNGILTLPEFLAFNNPTLPHDEEGLGLISAALANDYILPFNIEEEPIYNDFQRILARQFDNTDDVEDFGGLLVAIAASGNNATDAFAPASWPNVMAVSASRADSHPTMWANSNQGQVIAPGAWHPTIKDEYIAGTSFATPLVSMLVSFVAHTTSCNFEELIDENTTAKNANLEFVDAILTECFP